MTTFLLILFWFAIILAVIGALLIKQRTWASAMMYWSIIVALILLGVQTHLFEFLRPVLDK